jgi:hypothetical protein
MTLPVPTPGPADAASRVSNNDWWCSGNPLFLEPYWRRHAAASAVVVSGWHRMSYTATDGVFQSVELKRQIRRLHRAVGNAVADGKLELERSTRS